MCYWPYAIGSLLIAVVGLTITVTAAQEDNGATIEPALTRKAAALMLARCAVCHTTDLIVQQRLPEERWAATVEKMVHWGADLSKDEQAALVQFLTARYHPGAPDHLPSIEEEPSRTNAGGKDRNSAR